MNDGVLYSTSTGATASARASGRLNNTLVVPVSAPPASDLRGLVGVTQDNGTLSFGSTEVWNPHLANDGGMCAADPQTITISTASRSTLRFTAAARSCVETKFFGDCRRQQSATVELRRSLFLDPRARTPLLDVSVSAQHEFTRTPPRGRRSKNPALQFAIIVMRFPVSSNLIWST